MTWTLYGIPHCDTVRKARRFVEQLGVNAEFVNFRAHPLSADTIASWVETVGFDALLNRRSTTWRSLSESQQSLGEAEMIGLMCAQPTLIKRPVLCRDGGALLCGFDEARWREAFGR